MAGGNQLLQKYLIELKRSGTDIFYIQEYVKLKFEFILIMLIISNMFFIFSIV